MRETSPSPKRQALIDAAIELFSQEGFWNTTTARIAQHAGVATGTLFTYFPSKNDLIDEVYSAIKFEAMHSMRCTSGLSFQETLRLSCSGYLSWCLQNPEKHFLKHQLYQENAVSKRMQDSLADVFRFDDFFRQAMSSGEIIEQDPELLVAMVSSQLEVAVQHAISKKLAPEEVPEYAETIFQMIWKSIAA